MATAESIAADIYDRAVLLAEVMGWTVEETIAWLRDQLFGDHEPDSADRMTRLDMVERNNHEHPPVVFEGCSVCWGTHGCILPEGHDGSHFCCCECVDHPDRDSGCVGTYPYYGPDTRFYGVGTRLVTPLPMEPPAVQSYLEASIVGIADMILKEDHLNHVRLAAGNPDMTLRDAAVWMADRVFVVRRNI